MQGFEQEVTLEFEVEITDLDPPTKSSRIRYRRGGAQRHSPRTHLRMALFTLLAAVLFSWLLLSQWPVTGVVHQQPAFSGESFTASPSVPLRHVQIMVFQHFIYTLDQDGILKALWTRHKYEYLLWQHSVSPPCQLLQVNQDVVYLACPHGGRVALRASDGTVLWAKKRRAF